MSLKERIKRRLEKEKGTFFKNPGGKISFCLIYPNIYYIGMSNLGFQGIYGLLNSRDDVLCERTFLPDEEDIEKLLRSGAPLFSYESGKPLTEFEILCFSISFENDYPEVLRILKLAHIPLRSSERNHHHPLIVGGGIALNSNPEPLADFFDIIMFGDGEVILPEFIDALKDSGTKNKKELFNHLRNKEGFYIPSMYEVRYYPDGMIKERKSLYGFPEKIKRPYLKDLSRGVRFTILTPDTEFSEMHLIEVMRGCPWKCNFCLTGHMVPLRVKPINTVLEEIQHSRAKKFGIIGSSLTDYRHIKELLSLEGVDFSITSLRASPEAAELVGLLKGKRSVSIAPEAGCERLRELINKRIKEEHIIQTSKLLFQEGIEILRLYFMIGLPEETDEDVMKIVELTKKIRGLSKTGLISLSISIFVPKPHTPLERFPMEKPEVIKRRLNIIKRGLKGIDNVRVFHELPKYAFMQGLFAQGSRRISEVLEKMLEEGDWIQASRKAGIQYEFYIFRKKELHETLPWDFIE